MKKCFIPQIGDVFRIEIDSESFALGQVIYADIVGLNIIYDYQFNSMPQLGELADMSIAIMGYTSYGFIEDGRWKAVGNAQIPVNIVYPEYICKTYGNGEYKMMIYGYDHSTLREAKEEDKQNLDSHISVSPKVIEEAIKARFGILPSNDYDKLLYRG